MTWIKPSFLWMMYRAGWGEKDSGQARILAIDITRDGFEWALAHSCLSHFLEGHYASKEAWEAIKAQSPVRIQWDPERDLHLNPLDHRSIQIGLSGEAVKRYVHDWIQGVEDITDQAHAIHALVRDGRLDEAREQLPNEQPYEVSEDLSQRLAM